MVCLEITIPKNQIHFKNWLFLQSLAFYRNNFRSFYCHGRLVGTVPSKSKIVQVDYVKGWIKHEVMSVCNS